MQHFIATYGYLAIFVLMLAESACIPVPSELIMTFGGALAAGAVPGTSLNLAGVILAGTAGNVAGSYIAWAVGRYLGLPALTGLTQGRRAGRVWLRERDLDRAVGWFGRHGGKAVLIGRVLPVIRTFISLPAGIAGMAPVRFGVYTTIGCLPWTAALATAGFAVGANWESIVSAFHGPTYIIAAVVLLAVVVLLWLYWRRRAEESAGSAESADSGEPRPAQHSRPGTHRRLPQCLAKLQCPAGYQPGQITRWIWLGRLIRAAIGAQIHRVSRIHRVTPTPFGMNVFGVAEGASGGAPAWIAGWIGVTGWIGCQ
ncbi:MAG TPA: DedA family protein [Streptosporangiaceae bacterium]|nr:DedA family protein [Streptosporangiaceae bacterium]